jgi:hypothetical protein
MNNVLSIFPHVRIVDCKKKILYGCIVSYGPNIIPIKLSRIFCNGFYIIVNDKIRGPIKYYIINPFLKHALFEVYKSNGIMIIPYRNFSEYYDICNSNSNLKMIAVAEFLFEDFEFNRINILNNSMNLLNNCEYNFILNKELFSKKENFKKYENDIEENIQYNNEYNNEYEILKSINNFVDTL